MSLKRVEVGIPKLAKMARICTTQLAGYQQSICTTLLQATMGKTFTWKKHVCCFSHIFLFFFSFSMVEIAEASDTDSPDADVDFESLPGYAKLSCNQCL